MNLPTLPQCQQLFEKYKVPGTVRLHCESVHTVAVFLAEHVQKQGYPLNLDIVKPFSLLHDFMKAVVLERLTDPPYNYTPTAEEVEMHQQLRRQYHGGSETKVAYLILKEDYPEFAQLFLELDELTTNPQAVVSAETRFINYVDWRVLGNKVVPLSERMEYIYQRYGHWIQKKHLDWPAIRQEQYDYEQQLFKHLSFSPAALSQQIQL